MELDRTVFRQDLLRLCQGREKFWPAIRVCLV